MCSTRFFLQRFGASKRKSELVESILANCTPPDVVGIPDLTVIKKEEEAGTLIVERVKMSSGFL